MSKLLLEFNVYEQEQFHAQLTKENKILYKRDMQISIPFTLPDVGPAAGLLLAYMQVQLFQNAADAVYTILRR